MEFGTCSTATGLEIGIWWKRLSGRQDCMEYLVGMAGKENFSKIGQQQQTTNSKLKYKFYF